VKVVGQAVFFQRLFDHQPVIGVIVSYKKRDVS
jgi:hypothetical protein